MTTLYYTMALQRVAGASPAVLKVVIAARSTVAHKRYYATPSEQEPDPQLNGYPQLPFVSRQHLPPYGWQDQQMRRNFGDTIHEEDEVLSMWGPDIPPIEPQVALRRFMLAFAGFATVGWFIKKELVPDPPAVRREYPFSGLVTELGGLDANKARAESNAEE